jgi:hypothetical protein
MASIITRSELMGKNPHNAAVPIADHSSVFDGVDFDIYTLDGLGSSLALEDAVDVSGGVPVLVKQQIGPIRNQAAAIDHGSPEVNCGQSMPCRERRNQLAMRDYRCAPRHDQTTVRGAREFRGVLRTPSIPRRATAPQN